MNKKLATVFLISILLILIMPIISAGLWSDTWSKITGQAINTNFLKKIRDFFNIQIGEDVDGTGELASLAVESQTLIVHYNFDSVVETTIQDMTGNGNDGTLVGGAIIDLSKGYLILDGVDDYVDVPDIELTDDWAFSAWYKTDSSNKMNLLGYKSEIDFFDTDKIGISNCDAWSAKYTGAVTRDGQWHHVVGQRVNGNVYLYFDGELVASRINQPNNDCNAEFPHIGKSSYWLSVDPVYFNGVIDEIKIFDRSLTDEEILVEYNSYTPPDEPLIQQLLAHYSFENNANDITGNGNDGTFLGNANTQAQGVSGQGLQLSGGTRDSVSLGTNLANINTYGGEEGIITISAWVKPDNVDKYNYLMQGTGFYYLSTGATGSNLNKMISMVRDTTNNKNIWPKSNSQINSNEWIHIVFIFEGGQGYQYYINGQPEAPVTNTNLKLYPYLPKAYIGRGLDAASDFKGLIDELKIYNYALTEAEILTEYNANKPLNLEISISTKKDIYSIDEQIELTGG